MDSTITFDIATVAKSTNIPLNQVKTALGLLDDGNTVPFITRYRLDQTGGLDEEQIRAIRREASIQRGLAERKQAVLKAIETQGKLTEEISESIKKADAIKKVEDIYLPYKPKRQTLATAARQQGLEPLAKDILEARLDEITLATRALDFVRVDKGVENVEQVMQGVKHIIAEYYSENTVLREKLREIMWESGELCSTAANPADLVEDKSNKQNKKGKRPDKRKKSNAKKNAEKGGAEKSPQSGTQANAEAVTGSVEEKGPFTAESAETPVAENPTESSAPVAAVNPESSSESVAESAIVDNEPIEPPTVDSAAAPTSVDSATPEPAADSTSDSIPPSSETGGADNSDETPPEQTSTTHEMPAEEDEPKSEEAKSEEAKSESSPAGEEPKSDSKFPLEVAAETPAVETPAVEVPKTETPAVEVPKTETPAAEVPKTETPAAETPAAETSSAEATSEKAPKKNADTDKKSEPKPGGKPAAKGGDSRGKNSKNRKPKKPKKEEPSPFQDYFNFKEPIKSAPPHRVLAINRGERSKVLRAKVSVDNDKCLETAKAELFNEETVYREFLEECVNDALGRLIIPSLEREARREMTEKSERHAVVVFARNLRNLLLQPPVRDDRVLAIDPGFRSGCKVAVLTEFGEPLATELIQVVGKDERINEGKEKLVKLIQEHNVKLIAIGNGTACRHTEKLVASVIGDSLSDQNVSYVIVNESGASVYSTSSIGREELPDYDPTFRSAISIGRRLLDPLSELVKITAANIGVGLYQHDVKSKHISESLDEVVSSCVNFVGVDVNTASPSLLKYVSGLNQLTARRLFDYRQQNGPFKSREEFKKVPGFGDVTYTQSAGFLRISNGAEPLDGTSIHPESYDFARRVMEKLDFNLRDSLPVVSTEDEKPAAPAESTDGESGEGATAATATTAPTANVDAAASSSVTSTSAANENLKKLKEKIKDVNKANLAAEIGIGALLLDDILENLCRPGRDPREELPKPIFRKNVLKLEHIEVGMELDGRVINVVDFGAFVDIGIGNTALVHVSVLSYKFVKNPHDIVSVGDTLRLWVTQVDKERRRVSLTAIKPGTKTERQPKRTERSSGGESRPERSRNSDRRPRNKNRRDDHRGKGSRQDKKHRDRRPRKPKEPPKPITEKMIEGKEAMNSFSDLQQFFDINKKDKK